MTRVLVVEDDRDIADLVVRYLERAGFEVSVATSGDRALVAITEHPPDLIVLDLMLPEVGGLEICRAVRRGSKTGAIPIIMVTARAEESERIAGLETGADDYLPKPFALAELLARVRALLRRAGNGQIESDVLSFADLELDLGTREVRRGGRPIELTRTEFSLLELLLRNPRQVLTRSIIFERVWGFDFGPSSNSLDVYIGYLRRKTEDGGATRLIHTVRGVGYALRER